MSISVTETDSPRGASTPPGLRFAALAGICLLNLAILVYAISRALPHEPSRAPSLAATTPPIAAPPAAAGAPTPPSAGLPAAAAVVNPIMLPDAGVIKGAYIQHCSACHGKDGRGDGPAAVQLYPRPRDFVASPFRFASTGGGQEPLIAGLERTVSSGIPRSAMPGFGGVLEESVIAGLARYVLSLRSSGQPPIPSEAVDVGARPPTTPGLIARGAELYEAQGCITCHGPSGHGDGEQSRKLVDSIGRPVRPADLASGFFKSGQGPADLCRTILKGVPGTPMIAYEPALVRTNPDGTRDLTDAWALVAYIQSFSTKDAPIGHTSGMQLGAAPAVDEAMLFDPAHVAWLGVSPTSIELRPLWQRIETITHVDVRIVRSSDRIAICMDWRDGTQDLGRDHSLFADAVAVMFAMGNDVPALPMGVHIEGFQAQAPVNIWHWKASRQYLAAKGVPFEPESQPPGASTGWEVYGLPVESTPTPEPEGVSIGLPSFRAAQEAGNVHQSRQLESRAVLEANAEGFGTLALQPPEEQDVLGTAAWANGLWRVVMVRSIRSADRLNDRLDIDLVQPRRIPITFAVWDGSKGDRDGVKLISGWHWLTVMPPEEGKQVAGAGRRAPVRKDEP